MNKQWALYILEAEASLAGALDRTERPCPPDLMDAVVVAAPEEARGRYGYLDAVVAALARVGMPPPSAYN